MGNSLSLDAKGDIFLVVAISHICIHLERTRGIRGDVMIPSLQKIRSLQILPYPKPFPP